jgi:hypothetical protein
VPARAEQAVAIADVHAVPARERVRDRQVRLGVGVAKRAERLLAEDDAEAERGVGRVALEDRDVDRRIDLAQQDREVEPGGPAADHDDLHASASSSRSSWLRLDAVGKSTSSSQPASS